MKMQLDFASAALLFGAGVSLLHSEAAKDSGAAANPESVRLIDSIDGKLLYFAYCAVCHAADARGGGPMAESLKIPPPDLTRIALRHGGAYPDALVERIIAAKNRFRTPTEPVPCRSGGRSSPR